MSQELICFGRDQITGYTIMYRKTGQCDNTSPGKSKQRIMGAPLFATLDYEPGSD